MFLANSLKCFGDFLLAIYYWLVVGCGIQGIANKLLNSIHDPIFKSLCFSLKYFGVLSFEITKWFATPELLLVIKRSVTTIIDHNKWYWILSPRKKCPHSELFWSAFSRIPYSVRIRENTCQNNSGYGHFSRSVFFFVFQRIHSVLNHWVIEYSAFTSSYLSIQAHH